MLRKLICGTLWLLATGVTAAIVYRGMSTNSWIVTALGAIGIISACCGIYIANDGRINGARGVMLGGAILWLLGEGFVIPAEVNFWEATVSAKAEREMDYQRQADGRRLILDNTANQLKAEAPTRPMGEIQADINAALSKTYARKTLASLTGNCSDLASPSIRFCKDVFALQKELATAQDRNTKSSLIWEANSQLAVDTSKAHGAHDGPAALAAIFGGTVLFWRHIVMCIMIGLLFVNRGFGLAMSSAKTLGKAVPEPVTAGTTKESLPVPDVTEPAIALPAPVTEAPFLPEPVEVEAVTVAAEPASEPVAEAAPVTPSKRMTKKQRDLQKLFPEVSASVPQIHLPIIKVDHLQEALDAVIDEGRSGHLLSSAIGTKRVNAVLKRSGVPLISKEKFDKLVRERCRIRGVRVDSLVGRQLRFEDDETAGKKGSTRLGKNRAASASICA